MTKPLVLVGVLLLLAGCATMNRVTSLVTAPLTPIQAGFAVAVTLEDLAEDPQQDPQHYSTLEALHDIFMFPWTSIRYMVSIAGGLVWSIGDALFTSHEDSTTQHRITQLLDSLPDPRGDQDSGHAMGRRPPCRYW